MRIFYDSDYNNLPSGGGEQEMKDDLWERINSKNEKIEHLMAQIKQLEHNQDSLKEQLAHTKYIMNIAARQLMFYYAKDTGEKAFLDVAVRIEENIREYEAAKALLNQQP